MRFTVGTFNILSAGLSEGEFLSEGGDSESIAWPIRKDKIVNVLSKMLKVCDVIVTQENDDFFYILKQIRETTSLNIRGIYCLKTNSDSNEIPNLTRAKSLRTISMLNHHNRGIQMMPKDPNHESNYQLLNELNSQSKMFPTFGDSCGMETILLKYMEKR